MNLELQWPPVTSSDVQTAQLIDAKSFDDFSGATPTSHYSATLKCNDHR